MVGGAMVANTEEAGGGRELGPECIYSGLCLQLQGPWWKVRVKEDGLSCDPHQLECCEASLGHCS